MITALPNETLVYIFQLAENPPVIEQVCKKFQGIVETNFYNPLVKQLAAAPFAFRKIAKLRFSFPENQVSSSQILKPPLLKISQQLGGQYPFKLPRSEDEDSPSKNQCIFSSCKQRYMARGL